MTIDTLILGGRGNIGAGLRTYLPRLDPGYRFTCVDLPGWPDLAADRDEVRGRDELIDLDIAAYPERLIDLMRGRDLVIYLARTGNLAQMNALTDAVFEALLQQARVPLMVAASSVHACDGAYSVHDGEWAAWANRDFDAYDTPPARISSAIPACPTNGYGREKAHVEAWCQRVAAAGHGAVAARWGGINHRNAMVEEHGYFALWCHQEDAARFVHACWTTWRGGRLRSGAHYFVTSNNGRNIFDLELPRRELGYEPAHDAEAFYR